MSLPHTFNLLTAGGGAPNVARTFVFTGQNNTTNAHLPPSNGFVNTDAPASYSSSSNFYYAWFENDNQVRTFDFEARQASGTQGNGGSAAGYWGKFFGTITVPANVRVIMCAGNSGYGPTGNAGDGNSGAGGGACWIAYQNLTGSARGAFSISSGSYTGSVFEAVCQLSGAGGGNDLNYTGSNQRGPSNNSYGNSAISSNLITSNGNTYSRAGTTYGGYPNGGATDDSTAQGGYGSNQNYFNTTYINITSNTGAFSDAPNNPGYFRLQGDFAD